MHTHTRKTSKDRPHLKTVLITKGLGPFHSNHKMKVINDCRTHSLPTTCCIRHVTSHLVCWVKLLQSNCVMFKGFAVCSSDDPLPNTSEVLSADDLPSEDDNSSTILDDFVLDVSDEELCTCSTSTWTAP